MMLGIEMDTGFVCPSLILGLNIECRLTQFDTFIQTTMVIFFES